MGASEWMSLECSNLGNRRGYCREKGVRLRGSSLLSLPLPLSLSLSLTLSLPLVTLVVPRTYRNVTRERKEMKTKKGQAEKQTEKQNVDPLRSRRLPKRKYDAHRVETRELL